MAETKDDGRCTSINDAFEEATQVSSLAHYARVQAHEADLKARYAMMQAERAMCEAESVRQIAESLTHTAHAVARIALDFANNRGAPHPRLIDQTFEISTEYQQRQPKDNMVRSPHQNTSPDSLKHAWECERRIHEDFSPLKIPTTGATKGESSSYGMVIANTPIHSPSPPPPNSPAKYTEAFPTSASDSKEAHPKEIDSSHSLPIVWENSYQGAREFKPVPWSEKKSLRKMQRKLRNLDLDSNDIDEGEINGNEQFSDSSQRRADDNSRSIEQREMDETRIPASKEKLLRSVRFSETMTDNNRTAF